MARVHIEMPERFIYRFEVPLRTSDINYGGHLGHDSVLSLTQEARASLLASWGYSEADLGGAGLIIADAALVYKSEAFYGEVLIIDVAVGNWGSRSCDMFYRITEKKTGREVALAKTGIVFYDYGRRKTSPVPEGFRTRVMEAEGQA
jgi:acyl-CoA thioesterase FadM